MRLVQLLVALAVAYKGSHFFSELVVVALEKNSSGLIETELQLHVLFEKENFLHEIKHSQNVMLARLPVRKAKGDVNAP